MELDKKRKIIWEVLEKRKKKPTIISEIVDILLKNRGLITKEKKTDFFNPSLPEDLTLKALGINKDAVVTVVKRVIEAKKNREQVIVFGDYDADGICGSVILWECLYAYGLDVLPYIPDRFSEGYGLRYPSVVKLKQKYPQLKLIFTVDNGIVANNAIAKIKRLGIDVIVTDHHQIGKYLPKALTIVHTDKLCGAAVAWILAREIASKLKISRTKFNPKDTLDMTAIGTVSDQMLLTGPNRSFAKYGIKGLNETKNLGLKAMYREAQVKEGSIGTYEINYIISPRINAVGRISHAIESMRLLCTRNKQKAHILALHLGKVNRERQRIVDETIDHARKLAKKEKNNSIIIISNSTYNEGVVGLAAGKLVEEYYKPAIVISKGNIISKGSARSVNGYNIIEAIRRHLDLTMDAGGHPMAAGISLKTKNINKFKEKLISDAKKNISPEMLLPKMKIDLEIGFGSINEGLLSAVKRMNPTGLGNPTPVFVTKKVKVFESRLVGANKHLKLVLNQGNKVVEAVAFNMGNLFDVIKRGSLVDVVYTIEENIWKENRIIQLKVKDIVLSEG